MHGVYNSETDPKSFTYDGLLEALKEPDYLISLMQAHAFNTYRYNLEGDWDSIAPGAYKKFINGELQILENQIWSALERFQIHMRAFKEGK